MTTPIRCAVCGAPGASPVPLTSAAVTEPACSPDCAGLLLLQRAASRDAAVGRPWDDGDRQQLRALLNQAREGRR